MAVDPLSPIAPARIRALLLPVGRIKRTRFLAFVELLQQQSLVRLGDISPDSRSDRNMFSPLAFPGGTLLYDLSTSLPPPSHLALSPFEQFREPLLIIGVGDASEYQSRGSESTDPSLPIESSNPPNSDDAHKLQVAVEDLKEQFPRAYLHSLMMFDAGEAQTPQPQVPQEAILVPRASLLRTTTMKTIMCDVTALLLAEMTTLARSIQALPSVPSPASQSGATTSTPSWANTESTGTLAIHRNSQTPNLSRPDSPLSGNQNDAHRMSMPVLPTAGGHLQVDDPRAVSPGTQGTRTPPTTFDEISVVNAANSPNNNAAKSNVTKDAVSDRVSIHGFGSGGVGERARNKGRGRISIVIGTLYMCAGQWQDAIRELTEGATRARAFSDHLWHAKGLEHILVCLLLFAWSDMDFQIPQLCYPISDKSSVARSPQHTPTASVADISAPAKVTNLESALESLNALLPDMINMILNLYTRASNFVGESLPPFAFSECVIRFSKLLAAVNLSAGHMDKDTLQHLVCSTPHRQKPRLSVPRLSVHPTRNDVAALLFRALPGPVESAGLSPGDRVVILAGIASVLSSLGLQRKKAIIMKDFVTSLIPGLVQARKVGAAEMGVHPAAGLAALNIASSGASNVGTLIPGEGQKESGIDEFLDLLSRIYGIPASKKVGPRQRVLGVTTNATNASMNVETSKSVITDIIKVSSLRAFGSVGLKLDILRMCLNFCEALPDFNGVLHFTALLLRMAGPGTAPRPNSTDVFVSLPRDEQVRLYSNFSRTVGTANKLGLMHEDTEYWDDFLVRGLFILEEPIPLRLTLHRPAELKSSLSGEQGPFLHNPWLKPSQSNVTETVLVAKEDYRFVIALQNPYDFELNVDSLRIAAEGVDFVAKEEHFFLGPYRTQKFQIAGVPRSSGTMKIIGCFVKIIGCRERLFPIFPDPWRPTRESKMKSIGLQACLGAPASRPSSAVAPLIDWVTGTEPKPDSLTFEVIPEQPALVVTDISVAQSSLMVLEGEKKRFTVTVMNTSSTTAVDFVHVTFQDSASTAIKVSASNKNLPLAELHELEVQLAHYPSLRWLKNNEEIQCIEPGTSTKFMIEVVGRPRLTDAIIQIDYANLGKRKSEVQERFFTRQVSIPISITVNASVQLQKPDIVSLSNEFAWSKSNGSNFGLSTKSNGSTTRSIITNGADEDSCLLLLDFRNSWPNPLAISLHFKSFSTVQSHDTSPRMDPTIVNEVIQPGHVNRVAMLIPKLFLKDAHTAIPSLNPANQRQFVVSASKISPETEKATREAFWYRDALLKSIHGTWEEEGTGRHGDLELRSIRFSSRMVEAIKLESLKIEMRVESESLTPNNAETLRQLSRTKFEVPVDEYFTLKTKVQNLSTRPITPLLRLQPHLANITHSVALDLDKRFSWTGSLQCKLSTLKPGDEYEHDLGFVTLCSGTFEVGAIADEIEIPDADAKDGARLRSDTQSLLQGDVIGEPKLRTWHANEPCIIVARR